MLTEKRRNIILQLLKKSGTADVREISEALGISPSTVRRDLNQLAAEGKLKRVHGGAALSQVTVHSFEQNMEEKTAVNTDEKNMIGKYAAAQINDNDFVFIDAGSTTSQMIDFISPKSKAVFVTNGMLNAKKLIEKGLKTYIVGGLFKLSTDAVVGSVAKDNISTYNFTKSFIGTNGISEEFGFTTPDADEAMIKKTAIEHSFISFVLADHSKFGVVCPITFAPITKCCVLTDKLPDKKMRDLTVIREVMFL